jgi:hypothetical protein
MVKAATLTPMQQILANHGGTKDARRLHVEAMLAGIACESVKERVEYGKLVDAIVHAHYRLWELISDKRDAGTRIETFERVLAAAIGAALAPVPIIPWWKRVNK